MHSFTDRLGRSWSLALTAVSIKAVRKLCDVDLLATGGGEVFGTLFDDAIKLCDVCYVLCREQCDKLGISDVQFGEGFSGDTLETAAEAVILALADFYPKHKGDALRGILKKAKALSVAALKTTTDQLASMDTDELSRQMAERVKSSSAAMSSERGREFSQSAN